MMGSRKALFLELFLLLGLPNLIASQTIIKSLPGYPGDLPFKLETGYIGVGDNDVVQLFYYFVESEGNPEEDPLIVWLAGGPGTSGLRAFFFENGPMQFQYGKYMDNVPALQLKPNSWTKVANVIFLDAPTVTGYSYTKSPEAVASSDTLSASQTVEFFRKFVKTHPRFLNNPMYITGISYSGIIIPMITEELYKGNDVGLEPKVNVKTFIEAQYRSPKEKQILKENSGYGILGYIGGNLLTDKRGDINSRFEYAYRMALLSAELFESVQRNCNGDYAEADENNLLCMNGIEEVNKRVRDINRAQILDPNCDSLTNLVRSTNLQKRHIQKSLIENTIRTFLERHPLKANLCRDDYHSYANEWANDKNVMKSLNVREGTVKEWSLNNENMTYSYDKPLMPQYTFNVQNSIVYHEKLSKRDCRALIFSGDHDMVVPHVGTYTWIRSMNMTITNNWEAWYVEGQVAGFKTIFTKGNYSLVFATVKGAGHTAPEFKPQECFELVKKWFAIGQSK